MGPRRLFIDSPGKLVLGSFVLVITLGTILLWLPFAHRGHISLLDLFFTATSATCVTGLATIPFSSFTVFGHIIILLLIQIGGLGLITMLLAFTSLFAELGMAIHFFAGRILDLDSWDEISKTLLSTLLITIGAELIGAFIIFSVLHAHVPFGTAVFSAIFHATSMFCNAGITVPRSDVAQFLQYNSITMATSSALMLMGGLGFFTWREIGGYMHTLYKGKRARFSLDTKIIFYGTVLMLSCGSVLFWLLERDNTLQMFSSYKKFLVIIYNTVSGLGGGLFTHDIAGFMLPTLLLILGLSFIGLAPASTVSGIKITTFSVVAATIKSAVIGRSSVEMRGRSIPVEQVYKAIAIVGISIAWILGLSFCLAITEANYTFQEIFVEAVSAFTGLGISYGITPQLSIIGKLCLIVSMIVGRIGSLTLIVAMKLRRPERAEFTYPEERIMLG